MVSAVAFKKSAIPYVDYVDIEFNMPMQAINPAAAVGTLTVGDYSNQMMHSSWISPTVARLVPAFVLGYTGTKSFELFSDSGYLSVAGASPTDQVIACSDG